MAAAARVFGSSRPLMMAAARVMKGSGGGGSANATSGLMRAVPVSPAMRKFLGVPEISRPEAVKRIWDYIKLHSLQNPADKREIYCDEKLKSIFNGKDKVGMLEIAKLIGPHFVKTK